MEFMLIALVTTLYFFFRIDIMILGLAFIASFADKSPGHAKPLTSKNINDIVRKNVLKARQAREEANKQNLNK